jgi:hypothetical protein
MVVALDLERDRLPVSEVDDAGVLPRPLQDAGARRRQPLQKQRRVLVPAVLRPEEREDRQLEVVGIAAEQLLDTFQLPVGEPEGTMERLFRDRPQSSECSRGTRQPVPAFSR